MLEHLLAHVAASDKGNDKCREVQNWYEKVASIVAAILRKEKYATKLSNKVVELCDSKGYLY